MPDLTLQLVAMRVLALVVLAAVQGAAVAAAAAALGDRGPRHDGRLSLAPSRHLDVVGAFSLVLFGLGWSRPVAIDHRELRLGRAGLVVVVLAATLALLVAAAVLHRLTAPALTVLPMTAGLVTAAFLRTAAALFVANAVFNLLPLPPLTGGQLLGAVGLGLPERAGWLFALAAFLFVATGLARQAIAPVVAVLAPPLIGGRLL